MNDVQKNFAISANKKANFIWTALCLVLTVAYLGEVIKGNRSMEYYAVLLIFTLVPLIFGNVILKVKGRETPMFKEVIFIGFGLTYAFVLLTTTSALAFVYILPLCSMQMLYKDKKYIERVGIAALAINILNIVKSVLTGNVTPADVTAYEIQLASLFLCFLGYHISISHLIVVENTLMGDVKDKLHTVVETVGQVKTASSKIVDGMTVIRDLTDDNIEGANQVVNSMAELADNNKILYDKTKSSEDMTETINTQLSQMARLIEVMMDLINKSGKQAEISKNELEGVVSITNVMSELSSQVEHAINEFNQVFAQVKGEIGTIEGITSQTNLLALNASIEAARAGNAGKGFAVVAEEIRQLSNNTKDSSSSIYNSLQSLEQTSCKVIESINKITESIEESLTKVNGANTSVMEIADDSEHLGDNIQIINDAMKEVANSNEHMVTNMHDITTVMGEMTTRVQSAEYVAKEMLSKYEQTSRNVEEVEEVVSRLVEDLGDEGFMKLEDLYDGLSICIDTKVDGKFLRYHTVVEKVTSEGIFINPLTKDGIVFELGKNKVSVSVEVVYRNVVYMWKDVPMRAEKEKNTLYYFIEIKGNPEVINRRKYTRLEISNSCKLKVVKSGEEVKVQMKNISANGFCFMCREDLFRDKKFEEIDLEINDFEIVNNAKLRGEILRVTESEGIYTVGGRLAKDYPEIDQYIKAKNRFE